jgi:tetrahydrodipicolinate N-succinyltransferase
VVHKCLVTNMAPAATVKAAMNNTFVQALQKQVDAEVAETHKLMARCEAEADAAQKALLGQGVSLMRRAYVNGMQV